MINLSNIGLKKYCFMDGDKTIVTKNPKQEIYSMFYSSDLDDVGVAMNVIDTILSGMFSKEDAHYIDDLDFGEKVILVKDYMKFHGDQLEAYFRGTLHTEQ